MDSSGLADDGDGFDCFLQGLGYRVGGGVLIEVQVGLLGRWGGGSRLDGGAGPALAGR